MRLLDVRNPFGAPVYHEETVGSTMDEARLLARGGAPHGSAICADFQSAGRGRGQGRAWEAARGESLLFTALLRFPRASGIPAALTIRAGLAVALAIEDFAPALKGKALIKWPNDIMLPAPRAAGLPGAGGAACASGCASGGAAPFAWRKAVGILAEADGGGARIGVGANVSQMEFPARLEGRATSIALALGARIGSGERLALLEKILARLREELEGKGEPGGWRLRAEARLYMRGERARFAEGPAGCGREIFGAIAGIGSGGELLIVPDGESEPRALASGEQACREP